jgi:hypothetical protein
MSQPVKLSDALVLDARLAAEAQERSIAGQVEFWARLGRGVELLLDGRQVLALQRAGEAVPLAETLGTIDTPAGRKRVEEVLARKPFPHFKQHPTQAGLLIRIDEDGTQTAGSFVDRQFVPAAGGRLRAESRRRARAASKSASPQSRMTGKVNRKERVQA